MAKKIKLGQTAFEELPMILELDSMESLESKRPRLFPSGNTDNEVATTSIFLASLSAVKEFREELIGELGQTKIKNYNVELHTFTELTNQENGDRPDGLIVLTSGKKNPVIEWACFIESKVGQNVVEDEQVEKYADFARNIGINDIITISNTLVPNPFESPNKIKKNSFHLYHWSWIYLSVVSQRLIRDNKIEDVDHVFILTELRRYFDDHKKLNHFNNMGKKWKESVTHFIDYDKSYNKNSEIIQTIIDSYAQEEKDISLHLTDKSDHFVELLAKDNRKDELNNQLIEKKIISSKFIVDKDKKNVFEVEIDFNRKQVRCYTNLEIEQGKAQSQTTNLIKKFEMNAGITDRIIVEAYYPRNKKIDEQITLSKLIDEKNQKKTYSVLNKDFGDEIKFFKIRTIDDLGRDFVHPGKFIEQLENIVLRFLNQVIRYR